MRLKLGGIPIATHSSALSNTRTHEELNNYHSIVCMWLPDTAWILHGSCFSRKWSRLSHPPPTLTMTRSLSS